MHQAHPLCFVDAPLVLQLDMYQLLSSIGNVHRSQATKADECHLLALMHTQEVWVEYLGAASVHCGCS